MNRSSTIRLTLCVFGALIPTSGLLAQAATPATKEEAIVLAPFTVSVEGSNGYKVSTATTATRTNTALIDIPQTVDVITKEFWNDVGATTFDQSFRYVANTYVRNRNAGSGDGVNLRGFETNGSISVDGVRLGSNHRDLSAYERLEVVKGPPSAVQGRAGGTGLLNYILKKPELGQDGTMLKYSFSTDQYDGQSNRIEFDTNISFDHSRKFAARVAGAWQNGNDYIKFQKRKVEALSPSFKWQIGPKTELVVVTELLKLTTPNREEGHGFAVYPVKLRKLVPIFNNATDPITALNLPYDFNIIGPGGQDKSTTASGTLFFTHQFTDWLFFRQVGNLRSFTNNQFSFTGEDNTKTLVNSQYTGGINSRRGSTAQGDLIAKYHFRDIVTGTTMVGYSYDDGFSHGTNYSGLPSAPFNQLDMVAIKASGYSAAFYSGRTVPVLNRSSETTNNSYSLGKFIQQDLGLFNDRLLITGGLRSDHDVSQTSNLVNNTTAAATNTTLNSFRYGVTYKFSANLALYAVKSVQNDATRTIQRYNGLLAGDPRLSEFFTVSPLSNLKEIGIKGEAFTGRMSYALNYWEMTRQGSVVNILANGTSQGSPVTFGTQTEIQGAKSKGFEFSAYGSITNRLSLIANYTKMTTSQAFTGQQNSVGYSVAAGTTTIPIRFAPTWNGNVFMKYSFRDTKNEGFEVKAGLSAIGPFLAQITNFGLTKIPQNQKSVDLGASYRWQKYDFDLMVTNVTNAPFLVTRDQPPRTVRLSVATRF